jgi:hypothetical protein
MSNQLLEGVKYVPYKQSEFLCYSEDNGQVITHPSTCCQRWECQRWVGGVSMAPELIVNSNGFRVCSSCGSPS